MRIVKYISRTRFPLLIALSGLAVFGFMAKSGTQKQEDIQRVQSEDIQRARLRLMADLKVEDLPVRNDTKGLSIIGVSKTPEGNIKIILRNDYRKTIIAYQFSVGSTTSLIDYFTNAIKAGIEPGELRERIEAIDVDPELLRRGIIVRAAVFEDATADGDPEFIQQIHDFRLGEMLQTEQFLTSLRSIRDGTGPEVLFELEKAKATMLKLENDKRFSKDVMSGLRNMRLVFSHEIEGVKNANKKDMTRAMTALIDHYQNKFSEIRDYNEKVRLSHIQQVR